jgi:hypothetical protein
MYLALRPPWGGGTTTHAPSDATVVAVGKPDAGTKPTKPRRPKGRVVHAPGSGDDGVIEDEPPPPPLTDADRRLEWRGEDVTLPPKAMDMSSTAEARPLDDGEINTVFRAQSGSVQDCVVKAATDTDLHATITVKLVVDGTGRVTRSRMEAPHYLFEHGLLSCAQRALGHMKFPATGAPTLVTLPIHLG